jgi:hypothetical protein
MGVQSALFGLLVGVAGHGTAAPATPKIVFVVITPGGSGRLGENAG